MNNERVTPKNAAKELQMDVITLRELMKREKLPIGYAIKREGKSKWGFYIYRHLLDQEKERLGMGPVYQSEAREAFIMECSQKDIKDNPYAERLDKCIKKMDREEKRLKKARERSKQKLSKMRERV